VEKFKETTNKVCMIGSIALLAMLLFIYIINYQSADKIRINQHTVYTEGKVCIIGMPYHREVNNISRDMAECMNQHALAINRMLIKTYGVK